MKKLLILLALAGLGASACGDDSGSDTSTVHADASVGNKDAGLPVSRGVQITNLGAACSSATQCMGPASATVSCLKDLGMLGGSIPSGYCTAECQVDAECGDKGSCPIANLGREPLVAQFSSLLGGLGSFLQSNCFQTCDKTAATPCARADDTCASIIDQMAASGGATGPAAGLGGVLGMFPEAKQTFCFPPIVSGDGGVPKVDAGTVAKILGGLDAGL